MSEFNNEDKRRKRRAGWIMFGSFVGIAGSITAITVPLVLDKDDNETKPAVQVSYSYDFSSISPTFDATKLYEKAGEPGAYTDDKTKAKGYIAPSAGGHPSITVPGHNPVAFRTIPAGTAFTNQWYITPDPAHAGSPASTSEFDALRVAPYGEVDRTKYIPYQMTTKGDSEDASLWEVNATAVNPDAITGARTNQMYFLGLALDHDFDGVSYDQLSKNEALKTKLVKFAIDKGAIKLGDYSSLTGGTYDPNHDGIGVGISLEPAFDNSINDTNVAAALASASAGSSFYKKLDVYSGIPDTPTPVTSVAEIDKLELPAKGYTGDHITIIGKTPHTATNDAEYQHIFYDTIFESVLSMVKKLDTLANVAANSKFSVLMFGYGLTYYKYAYKYNNIPLHEINRTYKAVFTAAAGAKILPPHEWVMTGSTGEEAMFNVNYIFDPVGYMQPIPALRFGVPFETAHHTPKVPPTFETSMYSDGSPRVEHIPGFATIAAPTGTTDSVKVYVGGTLHTLTAQATTTP